MSRPMRLSTYSVGEYAGFLVDVDAHSGRCFRAPATDTLSQRGPASRSRNSWYASFAFATAALPRSGDPSGRRRSVSVSTRLTKNDATDARRLMSSRPSTRRSKPAVNASITSSYRCRLKISVTLTLTPADSTSVIAGIPAGVAGILIITLGRPSRCHSSSACAIVASVSCARFGETSTDTKPSAPSSSSYIGRNRSAACAMSVSTSSQYASSVDFPLPTSSRSWPS